MEDQRDASPFLSYSVGGTVISGRSTGILRYVRLRLGRDRGLLVHRHHHHRGWLLQRWMRTGVTLVVRKSRMRPHDLLLDRRSVHGGIDFGQGRCPSYQVPIVDGRLVVVVAVVVVGVGVVAIVFVGKSLKRLAVDVIEVDEALHGFGNGIDRVWLVDWD